MGFKLVERIFASLVKNDMRKKIKVNFYLFCLYALLAFPLFYFVYKYGSPYLGMIDFFDYYKLYETMDYRTADSPLNMRLVSSFFVYCMSKTGLVYNTLCQIDGAPFSKVIYFNAVFFNYICVVVTAIFIFHLVRQQKQSLMFAFLAGLVFLLGFGTIFFDIMPLADAMSVLLFALILLFYFRKSYFILVPLALLIIQREYLLLATGLVFLLDFIKFREKYFLHVLICCFVFFVVHVVLRKLIFETARYSHHTNPEFILKSFTALNFPILPFVRQTLMTMNVFLLYVSIIAFKYLKGLNFNRFEFLKIMLLLLQLVILTFLLALGNNAGRYFYMLIPLVIVQMINEIKVFELEKNDA